MTGAGADGQTAVHGKDFVGRADSCIGWCHHLPCTAKSDASTPLEFVGWIVPAYSGRSAAAAADNFVAVDTVAVVVVVAVVAVDVAAAVVVAVAVAVVVAVAVAVVAVAAAAVVAAAVVAAVAAAVVVVVVVVVAVVVYEFFLLHYPCYNSK